MLVPATMLLPAAGCCTNTSPVGGLAVAVKVSDDGVNVTPAGTSPPTPGVATSVLAPGVNPSVQHAPALALVSVAVTKEDANSAAQLPACSAAAVPPPAVTANVTGTFCS